MAEALEVQLGPGITKGKFRVKINKRLTFLLKCHSKLHTPITCLKHYLCPIFQLNYDQELSLSSVKLASLVYIRGFAVPF